MGGNEEEIGHDLRVERNPRGTPSARSDHSMREGNGRYAEESRERGFEGLKGAESDGPAQFIKGKEKAQEGLMGLKCVSEKEKEENANYYEEKGSKVTKGKMRNNVEAGEAIFITSPDKVPTQALGSFVQTERPISLSSFQDAITKAMKEAMDNQFNDWFAAGKGKAVSTPPGSEAERNGKTRESGSQASFVPATNMEEPKEQGKNNKEEVRTEIGSYTKGLYIEACEQLSREKQP